MWKCKAYRITKTKVKRSKAGRLTPHGFKTYHKANSNQDSNYSSKG